MVFRNPQTPSQRFSTSRFNTDVCFDSNTGDETLDNEDVVVMGDYEDYEGSGKDNATNYRGVQNRLFGTDADLEGAKFGGVTARGNRSTTHRSRRKILSIEVDTYSKKNI